MRSYSVRDVERVLQLAPDTTRSLIRGGFVHPARGPRREYRFSFQDLIVLRTARALLEAGRTEEADAVYRQALAQIGPDPLLLFNQGVLLEDLGRSAAALAAYQTALEGDPDLADCHYNLARLYEALGKPQHAIRHLGQYRRLLSGDGR